MMHLTEEQLLLIATAYQNCRENCSAEEYLEKISEDFENFKTIYKSKRNKPARVGKKELLGL